MEIIHEEWRPVQIDEGYEVSGCGKVRSIDRVKIRKNGSPQRLKGRPLVACLDSKGYPQVSLGGKRHAMVHHLVATAFIGEKPDGLMVNHKDGNKQNNRVENLEYVTHQQNTKHAFDMGLVNLKRFYGEDHTNSKVSNAQRVEIVELCRSGAPQWKVGKRFGLSQTAVSHIIRKARGR